MSPTTADFLEFIRQCIITLGVPVALYLAWIVVAEMKKKGYQTTYAEALLRAVGAGQNAAQDAGKSIFTPEGRALAVRVGASYLKNTVPDASSALGITSEDQHAARVEAQIGHANLSGATSIIPEAH
jgi:hypothetical protein